AAQRELAVTATTDDGPKVHATSAAGASDWTSRADNGRKELKRARPPRGRPAGQPGVLPPGCRFLGPRLLRLYPRPALSRNKPLPQIPRSPPLPLVRTRSSEPAFPALSGGS